MNELRQLAGKSFLTLRSLSQAQITALIDDALREKTTSSPDSHLFEGKSLALVFNKPSTRTRAAFETAFGTAGGQVSFMNAMHSKEAWEDSAQVLGRMYNVIAYRGHEHEILERFAELAQVPLINALTDSFHPTQALADLMTIREEFGHLSDLSLAYFGDGRNNTATSLLIAANLCKIHTYYVCPPSLQPDDKLLASMDSPYITLCSDIDAISQECHVIYTDVWTSMGEEKQKAEREKLLSPYQVSDAVMAQFPKAIFLHCLPAIRGKEVQASVIEGKRSRVWQQAENRRYTIKTLLKVCLNLL